MQRKENKKFPKLLRVSSLKIGIVVSDYNSDITSGLLRNACRTLKQAKVPEKNVEVYHVPGSFELPIGCLLLLKQFPCDALVALGCVVKGETEHDIYISSAVSQGLMDIALQQEIPVGFGVLTVRNLAQARARIHKGGEATRAALTVALLRKEEKFSTIFRGFE